MISVKQAKEIIAANTLQTPIIKMALQDAAHMRLAAAIYSPVDVPAFPQSSMDGYAFAYGDFKAMKKLQLKGEMQAGSKTNFSIGRGEAARIFTGAPLPDGADTVIMQEKTLVINNELSIADDALEAGSSVRLQGSAIKAGQLALPENTWLTAGASGFLAGMGISEVLVYARPVISIVLTGNELQQPGVPLAFGEVYESNSYALKAALQQVQVQHVKLYTVEDDLALLKQVLADALANSDMVLLTGGVSVGEYDFVTSAAAACGVTQLFHKIKQRPGKPLYFGTKDNKRVFGLPGNPSSVLTSFYEYVLPALQVPLLQLRAPLATVFRKPAGLTHFLKAWFNGIDVLPLDAQESYRMSSFAVANCLIQVPEETTLCQKGELTDIHILPQ